jgi:hypothetical protein
VCAALIHVRVLLMVTQVDDQAKSAAKLAVHLLKQPQQQQALPQRVASLERSTSLGLGPGGISGNVQVHGIIGSSITSSAAAAGEQQQQLQLPAAGEGVAMAPGVAAAADALDALVALLEQYCHPSNTGSWSAELAVFLRHSTHYFMKVCECVSVVLRMVCVHVLIQAPTDVARMLASCSASAPVPCGLHQTPPQPLPAMHRCWGANAARLAGLESR